MNDAPVADGQRTLHLTRLMIRVGASRDRAAFAELFNILAPKVKGYLKRLGSDDSTAEDIAQDVLVTLWQRAASFDPARASLMTWVYTIARNRRIDRLRREVRPLPQEMHELLDREPEPGPDELLDVAEGEERLRAAVRALPAQQRQMLELAFYGDKSHTEIAAACQVPLGTVKSRVRLALERLRKAMGADD